MSKQGLSILSHVSIGTDDLERALAFYKRVLPILGFQRVAEHPGAIAYGRSFREFWVQRPFDGRPASVGNGTHIGFIASSKEAVDAFHRAANGRGGAPGPRPDYGEPYYGCFVRDPDGHKIEVTFWDTGRGDTGA